MLMSSQYWFSVKLETLAHMKQAQSSQVDQILSLKFQAAKLLNHNWHHPVLSLVTKVYGCENGSNFQFMEASWHNFFFLYSDLSK